VYITWYNLDGKNPIPAFGSSGLRPFGPYWTGVPKWRNQTLVTLPYVDSKFHELWSTNG